MEKTLDLLKQAKGSTDENTPEAILDIFKPTYTLKYNSENNFKKMVTLIHLYSFIRLNRGDVNSIIRQKLLEVLAFFVIEGGCDKKARLRAQKFFNFKPVTLTTALHTLRSLGYLVKDPYKSGNDQLNEELRILREYSKKHSDEVILRLHILS